MQRYGYHMMPTTLVLTFDQALDAATAEDAQNYRIIGPRGRTIRVKSAVYDPTTLTVTLHPSQRINIHYRYELIVDGTAAGGLSDAQGQLLDGKTTARPAATTAPRSPGATWCSIRPRPKRPTGPGPPPPNINPRPSRSIRRYIETDSSRGRGRFDGELCRGLVESLDALLSVPRRPSGDRRSYSSRLRASR